MCNRARLHILILIIFFGSLLTSSTSRPRVTNPLSVYVEKFNSTFCSGCLDSKCKYNYQFASNKNTNYFTLENITNSDIKTITT